MTSLGDGAWPGRLLPASCPYVNLFFLNVAQAIIAVFLSADFLGRDKKLDTTEAFYIRSISNSAYVWGKAFGILKVFLGLNLLVLAIGAVFSLIQGEMAFNLPAYLIYPLLISLPTLIFILGLSFFTMSLVRNQAVTFVLLLGYIAVSLFFLKSKLYGVWDVIGFFTPMLFSDFTGFFDIAQLVVLRMGYLVMGVALIAATIWKLPRLPQKRFFSIRMSLGVILFLVIGAGLFSRYLFVHRDKLRVREEIALLNADLDESDAGILSYDIDLVHRRNEIECHAQLQVAVNDSSSIPLVFVLNPGLKVKSIHLGVKAASFSQNHHLLKIKDETKHCKGDTLDVQIRYAGSIDENVMFMDISEEVRGEINRLDPVVAGKNHAYITPDYLLLTREAAWYPVIARNRYWTQYAFSQFKLTVTTRPDLVAISQGVANHKQPGNWEFKPEQKLNALSLVIGAYSKKELTVDSVDLQLYTHKSHQTLIENFDLLEDTIPELLKSIKNDYERKIGFRYPFNRFMVVETPIHYYGYIRMWSLATEHLMPEMVLFPENGGGTWENDFVSQAKRQKRRARRNNEELTDRGIQERVFRGLIGNNFIHPRRFFFGGREAEQRNLENWGKFMVFPMFFNYANNIDQAGFPMFNISVENYLFNRQQEQTGHFFGGLNTNDEVVIRMAGKSLSQLIEEENENTLGDVFAAKGNQLFNSMKVSLTGNEFDRFIDSLIQAYQFTNLDEVQFINEISARTKIDLKRTFDYWLNEQCLPAFLLGEIKVWEINEGNRIRYFMKVPVTNQGQVDGVINFVVREGMAGNRRGRFRRQMGGGNNDPDSQQSFPIKSGETVDIGFLLDQEPREVVVNTLLAANIPSSQRLETGKVIKDHRFNDYFEGVRQSTKKLRYKEVYEVIVDNEDEGCEVINTGESSTVKDWWANRQEGGTSVGDKKYGNLRLWNPPVKWELVVNGSYFGEYIKSAYYKRRGTGVGRIRWTCQIPESGNYGVYAYLPGSRHHFRRRRHTGDGSYYYTVFHDDGDVVRQVKSAESGDWQYLGEYYFSAGEGVVELSDKTENDIVVGDAIKWVRR
ncbi:hypothetical protein DMA11_08080 [Marinilabiliaceae bacterium JC017]|nr:hypothetical protein DMA11_08080 [Marinilabiliaceae bacterium JC017]